MATPDKRGRRTWRFRLNDTSILEVSTPPRATEKQVRRRGRWSLILGTLVAALMIVAVAYADQVVADSDVVTSGVQGGTITVNLSTGGSTNITVGVQVLSQGMTHATFDVPITASSSNTTGSTIGTPSPTSLSVTGYGDAGEDETSVSVTAPSTGLTCGVNNQFSGKVTFTTSASGFAGNNNTDFVNVTVNVAGPSCAPTNTAPSVAFDANQPSSATEGDTNTYNFTITDTETPTGPFTFVTGYPDCGSGNTLVSSSITNATGTFNCKFVDGLVPAGNSVVKVKVADNGPMNSGEASMNVLVSNANPVVANTLAFSPSPVDCGVQTSLTGISFSDAGVNDFNWTLGIDWESNNTVDYTDSTIATQGSYASQSHTYNTPGSYTATVSVTDKDGGTGSRTAGVTVNQVYTVSFLQPLDASTPAKVIGNTVKKGRVVPVKAIITDACTGNLVTDPTKNVTIVVNPATFTVNATDAVETFSDAGSSSAGTTSMRWTADSSAPGGGFWIYNLDTSGFNVGTAQAVRVKVGSTIANTNYAVVTTTK